MIKAFSVIGYLDDSLFFQRFTISIEEVVQVLRLSVVVVWTAVCGGHG